MGGESSILRDCEWDDAETTCRNGECNLRSVTLRDETRATVFQQIKKERKHVDLLTQASNKLKSLRHPSLVRYLASGTSSDGTYLVTEHVTPVSMVLPQLSPIEVAAGLYNIIEALIFLHDKVGVAHNNVCLEALYVGGDGCWRLGGLEHSCPFTQATPAFLETCRALRNQDSLAPEEKEGTLKMGSDLAHVRDAYSFGVVVEQLIEKLDELGDLTKTFTLRIQDEFLNVDPRKRPTFDSLLQDSLFRNDFLNIVRFLKNITMATEEEKKEFFGSLVTRLLQLPEQLVARRLAVPLLSRLVLLDGTANSTVIPSLLKPYEDIKRPHSGPGGVTPMLHVELFRMHVVPEVLRIFYVREVHIRLTLLAHFSNYVKMFDSEDLADIIFPQLLLGLRDCEDRIVAASLQALAEVVPILGGDMVIGGARKKFFSEGMPKFDRHFKLENDTRKNVASVMGKKILLKDLAAQSNGSLKAEEEKQHRLREREKKREEARLRREERRRQRQEMELAEKTGSQETEPSTRTGDGGDGLHADDKTSFAESKHINPDSDSLNILGSCDDAKSQDEWSDWEDPNKSNTGETEERTLAVVEVNENAISDEIERELELMDNDMGSPGKSPTLTTPASEMVEVTDSFSESRQNHTSSHAGADSAERYSHSQSETFSLGLPESHPSGSDVGTRVETHASDVHRSMDARTHAETHASKVHRSTDAPAQTSSKSSTVMKLGSKRNSKNANSKTTPVSQRRAPAEQLGLEFDVKAVEIRKQESAEMDFFADMVPAIKVEDGDPLLKMLETAAASASKDAAVTGKSDQRAETVNSVSFAVSEDAAAVEEAGGWDVEDAW